MAQLLSLLLFLGAMVVPPTHDVRQPMQVAPRVGAPVTAPRATSLTSCPKIPTTAPAGYRFASREDFTKPVVNQRAWFRWYGQPGGDPYGWWRPDQPVTTGGMLTLQGKRVRSGGNPKWTHGGVVTGGIGSRHTQVYGEYRWCMSVDKMPGTATVVLLWPRGAHQWPPEIDFFETKGATTGYSVSLHYGTVQTHKIVHRWVAHQDATRWNVYTAVWKPHGMQVRENGRVVSDIAGNPHVPAIPMRFDIQSEAVKAGATVGAARVGWVVQYAWAP